MQPERALALHNLLAGATRVMALQRQRSKLGPFDYAALMQLTLAPEGLTAGEVGTALKLTTGSVTKLIDRLEEQGLVKRQPNPIDRRSTVVKTTTRASRMVARDLRDTMAALDQERPLSTDERAAAAAVFSSIG